MNNQKNVISRKQASDRFWTDVKDLLTQKYRHPDGKAQQGIDEYLQEVCRLKLGGVVYNQGEEQTAKVIDGVIQHGIPTPSAS
jgi:hypothetical protein